MNIYNISRYPQPSHASYDNSCNFAGDKLIGTANTSLKEVLKLSKRIVKTKM